VEQALLCAESSITEVTTRTRAWAMYGGAILSFYVRNWIQAGAFAEESLSLFRAVGDKYGIGTLLNALGVLALALGDYETVARLTDESIALLEDAGNPWRLGEALVLSAFSFYHRGHYQHAYTLGKRVQALADGAGEVYARVRALHAVALFAHALNNDTEVKTAHNECVKIITAVSEVGNAQLMATSFIGFGGIVALQGQYKWTAQLWGAARALYDTVDRASELEIHEWLLITLHTHLNYNRAVETVRTQLGEQQFLEAWNEGHLMSLDQFLLSPASSLSPVPSSTEAPSSGKAQFPVGTPNTVEMPNTVGAPFTSPPTPTGQKAASPKSLDALTPRELEVLRLLAQGMTSAQIAQQLTITLLTVNSHVRSIYSKLGIASRSAATRYALEQHIV
jgi:DNA-binding CsgD family transcriptional regulator